MCAHAHPFHFRNWNGAQIGIAHPFHFRDWNGAQSGIVSITVAEQDAVINIRGRKLAKGCQNTIIGPCTLLSLTAIGNQTAVNMKGKIDCSATTAIVLTARRPNSGMEKFTAKGNYFLLS